MRCIGQELRREQKEHEVIKKKEHLRVMQIYVRQADKQQENIHKWTDWQNLETQVDKKTHLKIISL